VSSSRAHEGNAANVIPQTVEPTGTTRSLVAQASRTSLAPARGAQGIAATYGAAARAEYIRGYARETDFAVKVASEIAGSGQGNADKSPIMAAKDFASMWVCFGLVLHTGPSPPP
jgi:hippurate hydrolase